jgi:hypothetical protein
MKKQEAVTYPQKKGYFKKHKKSWKRGRAG